MNSVVSSEISELFHQMIVSKVKNNIDSTENKIINVIDNKLKELQEKKLKIESSALEKNINLSLDGAKDDLIDELSKKNKEILNQNVNNFDLIKKKNDEIEKTIKEDILKINNYLSRHLEVSKEDVDIYFGEYIYKKMSEVITKLDNNESQVNRILDIEKKIEEKIKNISNETSIINIINEKMENFEIIKTNQSINSESNNNILNGVCKIEDKIGNISDYNIIKLESIDENIQKSEDRINLLNQKFEDNNNYLKIQDNKIKLLFATNIISLIGIIALIVINL